jgi:hypothetical protein
VSAVLGFVASSVIHMFTPLHKNDYRTLPEAMPPPRLFETRSTEWTTPVPMFPCQA